MLLHDLWTEFRLRSQAKGHSPGTIEKYRYEVKRLTDWLEQEGESDEVETFTASLFRRYIVDLQSRYAPQTVQNHVKSLKTIFTFGVTDDLIESNPMAQVDVPKVPEQEIDYLNDEDIYRLLQTCDKRDLIGARDIAIITLMYDTGVRVSEVTSLEIRDLDIQRGRLLIRNGKGSRVRTVPVSANTIRTITHYLRQRERHMGPQEQGDPLFHSVKGDGLTRYGVGQLLERRGQAVGLHVYPHKLRHSFAMAALRNGAREYDIQDILGHATLAMTKRYAKHTTESLETAHKHFSPAGRLRKV